MMTHLHTLALLLFLALPFHGPADEVPDIPYERQLDVHWTDVPPVLDGKMDDACWQSASVAGDFRRLDQKQLPARQQSEVRLCYDADSLYVFFLLREADIRKLQAGMPDDTRDAIDVNKDVVEIFLDPLRTKARYFHFMTTPAAARYDARISPEFGRQIGTYAPEWAVAAHVGPEHWAVELRIPFAELSFEGGFIGTPQPGDAWGINFCRDQGYLKEWSFWSPTRDRSFHRPDQIGVAVFRGRREGMSPPAVRWEQTDGLRHGPGRLALQVDPTQAAGLTPQWRLLRNREPADKAGTAEGLALRFQILDAGRWEAQVRVEQDGKAVFTGRTFKTLRPVRELVMDIHRHVQAGLSRAASLDHPAVASLAGRLRELETKVAPAAARLADASALSSAQWDELATQVPEIEDLWTPARYGIGMLAFAKEPPAPFAVSTAGSTEKIFRDTLKPPVDEPVELWVAGRERESFQLVVMPYWQDVATVEIAFSALKGPSGEIPAECLEYSVVDFIQEHEAWGGGWTPDVLNPGKPFPLRKDRTQPVWIDVLAPAGTPPGDYRGTVTLRAGDAKREVPIIVHALGFDIPERRSLAVDTWYWPSQMWKKYYGVKSIPFTPELYEKHLKVLSKYRYATFTADVAAMWKHIRIYREADGGLTFDFSGLDWILEMGRRHGADAFSASFACNFAALQPLASGGISILDRATGAKVSTTARHAKEQGFEYVRGVTRKSEFAKNPVYVTYIRQFVEYLRSKDMLEHADYEIYDEPRQGEEWADITAMHGFLKRHVPELRLKSYGVAPDGAAEGFDAVGLYDIWAPALGAIDPARWALLRERQRQGESFWFYTCASGYRDTDGKSKPYTCYHQPWMASRIHGWAAWKLGVDGMLVFALNQVPGTNLQPDKDKYYAEPIWESGRAAGQGVLVYPGADYAMIPSIRLANLRDGLEDYEFFAVLAARRQALDPARDAALIREIDEALAIPEEILPWDWHEWTRDAGQLDARRKRLAELILKAGR